MYKNLLSLLFVGFTLSITAQPTWVARYNGPANKLDRIRSIAVASDGSVYVAGFSEGKKGNQDYAVVKYNAVGEQQWVARYNGPGNSTDNPFAIALDKNDNVYVTGGSIGANGTFDYATVRYNADGSFEWAARYEGARNDIAKDVQVKNGYVYVTGFADGANQFNGNEIVTIKYDVDGVKKWEADFNQVSDMYDGSATNREEGTSLAVDDAGNIYITGTSQKMVTFKYASLDETTYNEAYVFPSAQPTGNGRKVLLDASGNVIVYGFTAQVKKFAPDGTELWSKIYPGATFWGMTLDPSGNVYVTGAVTQTTGDDYLTVKYNSSDGSQAWSKTFNGGVAGSSNSAQSVAYAGNGSHEVVYVTGRAAVKTGRTTVPNIGTVKYNASTGEQLAAWFYDGPDKQGSSGFEVASNGQGLVYVGGETTYKTSYYDFTTLAYTDPLPAPVITSDNLIEPENLAVGSFRLTNYPNPLRSTGYIEFELPQQSFTRVSLFDNVGREVQILANGKRSEGTHRISFNGNVLSAGTYFIRLQTEKARAISKVVLAR